MVPDIIWFALAFHFGGGNRNGDALRGDHFPARRAGGAGRRQPVRVNIQLAGSNGLQFTKQNIRVGVAAGDKRTQRANNRGEKDIRAAGQVNNRLSQRGDNTAGDPSPWPAQQSP